MQKVQHLFCLLYSSGTVTISGGTVNATVDGWAAGIGGGYRGDGGTITISGGTVNATGGSNAAGIGGGIYHAGGTITISNAVVFATGGTNAEDIGKGWNGSDEETSVTKNSGIIFEGSSGQVYGASLTLAGNLTVDGTITSTVDGDGTHGGFVGVSSGATVFENCVFAGAITGENTTNCGGFVGWNSGSITYTDCLQKGTLSLKTTEGSATFNRGTAPAEASSNYYYLTPYGDVQGTQVFTFTATGCTVTATATVSDGSTDYYAASTEVTLSHADQTGYSFDGYTVTKVGTNPAETVEVNENVFQMPASNVTVTVAWSLSKESITLAHAQQTFSCSQALDFTDVTGLAAYIASGYDDGKVILSRVMKVPACTGLLIVGTEGETYQIPYATVNAVYSNFLKPVLEEQTVPQTEDSWHALDGRKLNTKPARRGLYLHNGKQEVVR